MFFKRYMEFSCHVDIVFCFFCFLQKRDCLLGPLLPQTLSQSPSVLVDLMRCSCFGALPSDLKQ